MKKNNNVDLQNDYFHTWCICIVGINRHRFENIAHIHNNICVIPLWPVYMSCH